MNIPEPVLAARVRTLQIIVGAIAFGLLTACAIMVMLVAQQGGPVGNQRNPDAPPVVTIVAAVMVLACFIATLFIPGRILASAVQRIAAQKPYLAHGMQGMPIGSDEAGLLGTRQVTLILSCALLEAPGLTAAIAYLLEAQPFDLVIVLFTAVMILKQFPTRERMRAWLERHLGLVAELRQLGTAFDSK